MEKEPTVFKVKIVYIGQNGYGVLSLIANGIYEIETITVINRLSWDEIKKLKQNMNETLYINEIPGLTEDFKQKVVTNIDIETTPIILKCLINDEKLKITEEIKLKLNKLNPEKEIPLDIGTLFLFARNFDVINKRIEYTRWVCGG